MMRHGIRRTFVKLAILPSLLLLVTIASHAAEDQPLLLGKQHQISPSPLPKERYREALSNNLRWFQQAGVLLGKDGGQGVAERIVIPSGNAFVPEMQKVFRGFQQRGNYLYSEMTRPDCNLETALAFYYASRLFGSAEKLRAAVNDLQGILYGS